MNTPQKHIHIVHDIRMPTPLAISQLDGNTSQISSVLDTEDSSTSSEGSSVYQCEDQFTTLPKIYSTNARSLFPKFDDFTEKLLNYRIDIAQIS